MSEENVSDVLHAVDAVNRRDADAFLACLHPDVVWEERGDPFPGLRGIYRGLKETQEWFVEAVMELWESLYVEVEEVSEAGDDRVILEILMTARGKGSGVETERRAWQMFWLTDGKIVRRVGPFWRSEEALEAAGLSD